MKTTINTALAALVAASTVFGGASAAFAGGSYYEGANASPIERVELPRTGAAVVVNGVTTGGEGDYYAGIDRVAVDNISTGSIANGVSGATPAVQSGGEGEYYPGLNRR